MFGIVVKIVIWEIIIYIFRINEIFLVVFYRKEEIVKEKEKNFKIMYK